MIVPKFYCGFPGDGSFGKVFKMKSKLDSRHYAVKVVTVRKLNEAGLDLAQLQQEIDILCHLNHQNIVRYFMSFKSKKMKYFNLVMELATGGTLAGQIKIASNPVLTEATITKWMQQCFNALVYMHEMRVLHRDIKPENLLLDGRNQIKIADLGLACAMNSHSFASSKAGTVHYMSYEKANCLRYDGRDDVWGMGCVLGELLANRRLASGGGALYMFAHNQEVKQRHQQLLNEASCKSVRLGTFAARLLVEVEQRPSAKDALLLLNGGNIGGGTESKSPTVDEAAERRREESKREEARKEKERQDSAREAEAARRVAQIEAARKEEARQAEAKRVELQKETARHAAAQAEGPHHPGQWAEWWGKTHPGKWSCCLEESKQHPGCSTGKIKHHPQARPLFTWPCCDTRYVRGQPGCTLGAHPKPFL